MDKKVVLAVAGAGKTTDIIDQLNLEERSLIVTYTVNNYKNLKRAITDKFGYIPENITLFTYFSFLYTFCFRPFLAYTVKPSGIQWENPPGHTLRLKRDNPLFYMNKRRQLYSNRIARLIKEKKVIGDIHERIEEHFDNLFIDEVQDIAGHDFNFLLELSKAHISMIFVGDFYQHTFDTSRDGNVNKPLYNNLEKYMKRFKDKDVTIDTEKLIKSHRCCPEICEFISDNIGISIESHRTDSASVEFIFDEAKIDELYDDNDIIKLFYKESSKYDCYSKNWGDSKGDNQHLDICVVLHNTAYDRFNEGKLDKLAPTTRNKLYVACTRANRNLYLIAEKAIKRHKN